MLVRWSTQIFQGVHLLDMIEIFIIESSNEIQFAYASELLRLLAYVDDVFEGVVGLVMVIEIHLL